MYDFESVIKITVYIISGLAIFLPIILAALWRKKHMSSPVSEGGYVLQQSKILFWVMVIGAVFCYLFSVMEISVANDYSDFCAGLLFIGFGFLMVYLAVYCLLWKIVVEGELLTIYQPFRPVRKIKFYEISEVKLKWGEYVAYIDGEKVFKFDYSTTPGIKLLYEQLSNLGKIKNSSILRKDNCLAKCKKEYFTVGTTRGEVISSFILLLILGGLSIFILLDGTAGLFYEIICVVGFILFAGFIIYSMIWKVTVSFDSMYVKVIFRKEKKYYLNEITRVHCRKENIVIYAGERKIVKVSFGHKNFSDLWYWLISKEDIDFFDGKGNHFTSKDYLETEKNR